MGGGRNSRILWRVGNNTAFQEHGVTECWNLRTQELEPGDKFKSSYVVSLKKN